jgi:parallel beta-helix repeat protein
LQNKRKKCGSKSKNHKKRNIIMKHIPIMRFSIIIMLFSVIELQARTCTGPVRIVCASNTIDCGINIVHISQADVGPTGFTISTPGRYCLIEDITWAPTADGGAAITITSSNVQLDLNGYVLIGPDGFTNNVGIKVGTPGTTLDNVQILGGGSGSVQNFSVGILFDPVNNVLIEDLSAINNGQRGAVTINGTSFVGGIAVVGTPSQSSKNVVLRRVNTSFNGGTPVALTATFGTLLNWVIEGIVEDSQFNNNMSVVNGTNGLFLSQSNDIDVRDSQANDNTGLTLVTGFRVDDNAAPMPPADGRGRIQLSRDTANNNIITGTVSALPGNQNNFFAAGFYLRNTNECTLIDCIAVKTTESVEGAAANEVTAGGFELDQTFDCRLERCISGDERSVGGFASGFNIAGNRITCVHCYAQNYMGALGSFGYLLENFTNFGPLATDTGIPAFDAIILSKAYGAVTNDLSVGIQLLGANNCVIDRNLITGNAPDGIKVQAIGLCTVGGNIIKHNQIENVVPNFFNAGGTGVLGTWAIEDISGSLFQGPLNTYYDNYGFDYPGDGTFTNFNTGVRQTGNAIANPTNGFIGHWTIPGDPPTATGITKLTNIDIIYSACISTPPIP